MKDILKQYAQEIAEKRKKGMRERYQLAKRLGFSSAEADVLSRRAVKRIILAAKEKGYQIPPEIEAQGVHNGK